jgi:formate dehydrogenase subunit gamma
MKMPRDDKFNPGQKTWATIAVCGSLVLVLSGFFLWFTDTSILAATIHTTVTLLMLVALAGHVFMALLNPDTNPGIGSILDGEVDETWAKHHHRLWYDRKTGKGENRLNGIVRQGRPG